MQQLMYPDCFYVYMNIPEELQQYPVSQMILHIFPTSNPSIFPNVFLTFNTLIAIHANSTDGALYNTREQMCFGILRLIDMLIFLSLSCHLGLNPIPYLF